MGVDHCDGRSFAQATVQADAQHRVQAGRLEPEAWDDVTEPRIDMARFGRKLDRAQFDHEFGAASALVPAIGMVP